MTLQAIIMAGGEGIRLRPLTMNLPKPLCPLLNKPVMGYAVELLRRHGVSRIGATLWYQPQKIRSVFGRGERFGIEMRYFEEKEPLGTAGSVKLARKQIDGTFFVLSGDGLTDCDLTKALNFHKAKGAIATLVLKRVHVPLPYGVVVTDREGRITRFVEKPSWSRAYSDLVNTGVYILEPSVLDLIPDSGMPDFGKDIFPALAAGELPLYGYETEDYWCDVGQMEAYMQAQRDLMDGRVNLPHEAGISERAKVSPTARIEGRCLIGPDTAIGPGAVIRDAVIGSRCVIGEGAAVENACLWDRAAVMDKARVTGSVLCDGASARQGADVMDGCALGKGASAGVRSVLQPGVRVWPYGRVASGEEAAAGAVIRGQQVVRWTEKGAECHGAETICGLCAAYVLETAARRVAVSGSENAFTALTEGALTAAGADVLSAGDASLPMLSYLVRALRQDGGVYAADNVLRFLDRNGQPLPVKTVSAMEQSALRREQQPAFARAGTVRHLSAAEEIYLAGIVPSGGDRPLWSPVMVCSDSRALLRLSETAMERMNVRCARFGLVHQTKFAEGETGFLLDRQGEKLTVYTGEGTLTEEQRILLILLLIERQTGRIYDLHGVPRLAERIGPLLPADESEACLRQKTLLSDALAAALFLTDAMRGGPLSALIKELPEAHVQSMDVPCAPRDKGRILRALCQRTKLPHTLDEGVRFRHEKGYASIVPDSYRNVVRVTGEAADIEFARELCDFYLDQISQIAKESKESETMP